MISIEGELDNKTIGARIRSIRRALGETTETFSKHFNPPASKGTISKWENEKYLPNNKRLKRIAELGGISVDELLYGSVSELYDLITENKVNITVGFDGAVEKYSSMTVDEAIETLMDYGTTKIIQEIPTIPQFVADYIGIFKEHDGKLSGAFEKVGEYSTPVHNWLHDYTGEDNQETFARAWLAYPDIEIEEKYDDDGFSLYNKNISDKRTKEKEANLGTNDNNTDFERVTEEWEKHWTML